MLKSSLELKLVWPKDLEPLVPELEVEIARAKEQARLELFGRIREPSKPGLARRLGVKYVAS